MCRYSEAVKADVRRRMSPHIGRAWLRSQQSWAFISSPSTTGGRPGVCWQRGHQHCLHRSGSPWKNGFAESFNGRFRDEFLNTELFTTAPEAQLLADRWRWEYNTFRPHSSLQGRTHLEAAPPAAAA